MEVGIKRWYDDARKWGRGNFAEECKETFESLQDLSSFLKKLEEELQKLVWKSCSLCFLLAVGVRLGWGGGGRAGNQVGIPSATVFLCFVIVYSGFSPLQPNTSSQDLK